MNETRSVQLTDYLAAIRRRLRVVLLITFLVTGSAVGASLLSTKQYDGKAQVLFRDDGEGDLINPGGSGADDPERELNTQVELIKLDVIAEAVRDELGIDASTADLLEKIETETSSTSDIVTIVARDTEPRAAAALANAFADEYVEFRRVSARENLLEAAEVAENEYQSLSPEDQASREGQALRARGRQLKITASLQTGGVKVIRRAKPPSSPAAPRPRLSGALGLFLGLLLGAALALILEFTDRRFRREDDVEELFDLPILASIPPEPRRGDNHMQREAFGLLAANLRVGSFDTDSNVVMITSPSPGEGKTSVTLGLACALARLGVRVIAIEADLRRPTFGHKTVLPQSPGVTGLVSRPGPIASALLWLDAADLRPVKQDNLKEGLAFAVLPAGEIPPHPQRLLARPAIGSMIEQARSLADVVLIDTPPIGTVNDAVTLSRHVDSVLVVARLNRTTKDAARRALRGLRGLNVRVAGVVVTDAQGTEQYHYYAPDEALAPTPGEAARS